MCTHPLAFSRARRHVPPLPVADCATQDYLGRRDTLTSVMGGLAVGAVVGLKRGSLAQGVGYGALCAGAMRVTDFFT